MDRQTLPDWVRRYNAEGVEGLGNRRGGGMKLRLISDQMAQLATWVEDGPDAERDGVVRWRRVDLARRIEVVFGGLILPWSALFFNALYSLYRIDLSRVWNIFFKYC